jgi:hypothetical protein
VDTTASPIAGTMATAATSARNFLFTRPP